MSIGLTDLTAVVAQLHYVTEIASRLDQISPLWSKYQQEIAEQTGLARDAELLCELRLALTEGLTNAIVHAHCEDGRPMRVELHVGPKQIEFDIFDTGPGFRFETKTDCPNPYAESGRGMFLVQAFVDDVAYENCDGTNVLRLRRHIADPHPQGQAAS